MTFGEYVAQFLPCSRSEGSWLRYLPDAYKGPAADRTDESKTEELTDLIDGLGEPHPPVDSSLVD